jgi:hypothetical protein
MLPQDTFLKDTTIEIAKLVVTRNKRSNRIFPLALLVGQCAILQSTKPFSLDKQQLLFVTRGAIVAVLICYFCHTKVIE